MTGEGWLSMGLFEGLCPVAPQGGLDSLGCFMASWETPILVLVLVGLIVGGWAYRRRRRVANPSRFTLPIRGGSKARKRRAAPVWDAEEENEQRSAMRKALSPISPMPATALGTDRMTLRPGSIHGKGNGDPVSAALDGPAERAPFAREDTTVQADHLADGTLQLLPDRLQIEGGPGSGEEIRFVRVPGVKQQITLGRIAGPPHQHVQLKSATVSRTHARLTFGGGIWTLRNESSTNPTIHNGRPLATSLEEVPLHDGDRIEVGEVAFRFHQGTTVDRLPLRSSWYTDRGRRAVNQDAVVVRTLPGGRELAAVCDGMGSHSEGGVASYVALEALIAALSNGSRLEQGVEKANQAVLDAAASVPDRDGMGTTLVAMLREGARYEIVNVGDSRAYRITSSGIRQITRDHSFVAEAVQTGRMSVDEANRSPWKNAVTRSLGADAGVDVDTFGGYDSSDPCTVVLCTDGVHGVLDAEDIMHFLTQTSDTRDLARVLGEQALINGGEDNVAVAAVRFGSSAEKARDNG